MSVETTNICDISIIIVNYKTKDLLSDCLTSIFEEGCHVPIEVIVVDNNSLDGSVEAIRNEFPMVKCIENPINSGFAAANNQVISLSKAPIIVFLNPDTIVLPGMLANVKQTFEFEFQYQCFGIKVIKPKSNYSAFLGKFFFCLD